MDAAQALSARTDTLVAMGDADGGAFIANLSTRIERLDSRAGVIPLTINDGGQRTCYVCCPSAAYVDYALAELRHFDGHRLLRTSLAALVGAGDILLRLSGIDRHVQVCNWLLATNLGPAMAPDELAMATASLCERFPRHAIVWRSLNAMSDVQRLDVFRSAGYALFPARQVYLLDCRAAPPRIGRDEKRDRALLSEPGYAVVDGAAFSAEDFERAAELYAHLYLRKYTPLNPHYTAQFLTRARNGGLINLVGLRNRAGQLDGIIGFFHHGDAMSAPVVGYDTSLPQALGLYRRLMAIGMERARGQRLLYNMSAGAAGFKRNRGAVPAIEYAAVYMRHLPLWQRFAAAVIRAALDRIGPTLLTRFEL